MKKLFLAFALVACFAVSALGQSSPPLRVKEADGSPNVSGVTTIVVSNGSITSVQGKTIYLTTGGGGGGGSPGGSSTQVQYNAAGSFGGISGFTSDGTNVTAGSGNLRATSPRITTGINDSNGNELILFTATASAVNEFTIANAATGGNPTFSATGDDADINIRISPKGVGGVVLSNGTAANAGLRFASDSTSVGWYRTAQSWTYTYTGTTQFALPAEGIRLSNGIALTFSTGSAESSGSDTRLVRTGTNTIRLANATTGAGNLIIGTSAGAIGTSGAGVLAFTLSTEPSTGPTDTTQLYYKDFAAGDGRLYLRNEASAAGSPVANLGDAQTFTGRITFSPGATTAGINVGSVAGNPSGPSNADLWYNTATNELYARINGANVALGSGGGGGITIGTTTITSGTNTRVLYNNAGVVGEYVITGTGNVMMSASPTTTGRLTAADANFTTAVTTGTGTTAGFQITANSLTTGNGHEISSSSVSSGNVVSIAATGTAAASNSKHALLVATSGANATGTQTTYGAEITNTSTGTSSTNIALSVSASGGTNNTAINVGAGQVLLDNGTASAPSMAWRAVTNSGFYIVSGSQFRWSTSGTAQGEFNSGSIYLLTNTGQYRVGSSNDVILRRSAAANWAFGDTDAASPVAQTLSVQNVSTGTTDTAGVNWTRAASRGTGTGAGGSHVWQVAPAGSTGSSQNALVTALTLDSNRVLTQTRDSIGSTSSDGIVLQNTTAAAAGAQQYSPRLRLTGQGWKTNATAASQTVDWEIENIPVQGAANPTTNLVFSSQINGGGYTSRMTVASDGSVSASSFSSSGTGFTYFSNNFSNQVSLNGDTILDRAIAAAFRVRGSSATTAATFSTPALTPAQITADQNNYAPGTGWFQRWSSDASRNVTGLSAGQDGQLAEVWNVGSNNIVLVHESASSTAANRFTTSTGADLTLTAGKCAIARYDTTSTRWRVYLCN